MCVCVLYLWSIWMFSHSLITTTESKVSQDTELETECTILDYLRESICYLTVSSYGCIQQIYSCSKGKKYMV